jgi:hypothetical protein
MKFSSDGLAKWNGTLVKSAKPQSAKATLPAVSKAALSRRWWITRLGGSLLIHPTVMRTIVFRPKLCEADVTEGLHAVFLAGDWSIQSLPSPARRRFAELD